MAKKLSQKFLEKLVKDKLKLVESSPNKVYSAAEKEQKRLLNQLLEEIGDLDTKEGVIQLTERNLNLVDSINKRIQKDFYKSGYVDSVKGMLGDMDEVKKLTDNYFKEGFETFKKTKADLLFGTAKKSVFEVMTGASAMEVALFKPIASNILDSITNGTTYSELVKNIRTTVTGNDKVDGQLQRYAKTWAGTSFSVTERNYTSFVSDLLSIQWYRYTGGEIEGTRCFCEERNGNYYHVEEIKSWGRGENIGGGCGYPWAGMIKGTNANNIFSNLGGWECKHSLIPVSVIMVPKSTILNAIKKGWYKPTEFEKQELGL